MSPAKSAAKGGKAVAKTGAKAAKTASPKAEKAAKSAVKTKKSAAAKTAKTAPKPAAKKPAKKPPQIATTAAPKTAKTTQAANPALGPAPSTAAQQLPTPAPAYCYMMRCADGSLYAGWTNDLARRMQAHRTGKGARYTHAHGGETLAYAWQCADKSEALRREAALKKLTKTQKEKLAADWTAQTVTTVRMATPEDAAAVVDIYNWYVTHSTATFQYRPSTVAQYRKSIADILAKAPFLVAYDAAGKLCGYACAHPWHERQAFSWDVETTVYLAPGHLGQGLGRRLYTALLALLKAQGYCNAMALVAKPNPGSEAFHRAMGYLRYGTEARTGYKFGQWMGLTYWKKELRTGQAAPAPVRLQLPQAELDAVLAACNAK